MLSALANYGGKSAHGTGTGRWIASLLPIGPATLYCEPCGGMAGILLQRPRSKVEIYNDISGDLCNWFRVVREEWNPFTRALAWTPHSRTEWDRCVAKLYEQPAPVGRDVPADIERARWFTVLMQQTVSQPSDPAFAYERPGRWRKIRNTDAGATFKRWTLADLYQLAERFKYVQIECMDAVKLLEELAGLHYAIIYLDPPYAGANVTPYAYDVDHDALRAVVKEQRGKVAISGYGEQWDDLGWQRWEFNTMVRRPAVKTGTRRAPRVEVLWTNYQPTMLPLGMSE